MNASNDVSKPLSKRLCMAGRMVVGGVRSRRMLECVLRFGVHVFVHV